MALTKEQILAADDLPREKVDVPEWGGPDAYVYVRTMTGAERDNFERDISENGKTTSRNIRAKLAAYTVVDDAGEPVFTPEDVDALGRKSAAALHRIFDVAARLNALTKADAEELAKNS